MVVGFSLVALVVFFFVGKQSFGRARNAEKTMTDISRELEDTVPTISPETAIQKSLSGSSPKMIDVRDATEYAALHIPDSFLVTAESVHDFPLRDDEEILIVGDDSDIVRSVSHILAAKGVPHFVIEGGLPAWEAAGGLIVNHGDPTSASDLSKVDLVTVQEFSALVSSETVRYRVLDVRSDGEKLTGDAIWIPIGALESRRGEIPPATNIALCGTDGIEAFRAAVRLFDLGFMSVKTLDGACTDLGTELPASE